MKSALLVIAVSALATTGAAIAQSGPDVVKAKCAGCHEVDKKKVGPAFKDIATKHRDNKDAASALVAKLKEGKGHMKVSATDSELNAAVQYVLSLK